MPTWLIVILSVIGGLFCWRMAFRFFLNDLGAIDGEDIFFSAFLAILCLPFTPFGLVGYALWQVTKYVTRSPDAETVARLLAGESRSQKAKRLAREKQQREAYIRELELQLDIA